MSEVAGTWAWSWSYAWTMARACAMVRRRRYRVFAYRTGLPQGPVWGWTVEPTALPARVPPARIPRWML